jgi:hypothetical protein
MSMKPFFMMSKGHSIAISTLWEFKKATWTTSRKWFYVGDWPWELIICLLEVLKNAFIEVDEAIFLSVKWHCENIFCMLDFENSDMDEGA